MSARRGKSERVHQNNQMQAGTSQQAGKFRAEDNGAWVPWQVLAAVCAGLGLAIELASLIK